MPLLPIWISMPPLLPGATFSILMKGSGAFVAPPPGAEGAAGGVGGMGSALARVGRSSMRSDRVQVKGGRSFRMAMAMISSSDSAKKRFQLIDTSHFA